LKKNPGVIIDIGSLEKQEQGISTLHNVYVVCPHRLAGGGGCTPVALDLAGVLGNRPAVVFNDKKLVEDPAVIPFTTTKENEYCFPAISCCCRFTANAGHSGLPPPVRVNKTPFVWRNPVDAKSSSGMLVAGDEVRNPHRLETTMTGLLDWRGA